MKKTGVNALIAFDELGCCQCAFTAEISFFFNFLFEKSAQEIPTCVSISYTSENTQGEMLQVYEWRNLICTIFQIKNLKFAAKVRTLI